MQISWLRFLGGVGLSQILLIAYGVPAYLGCCASPETLRDPAGSRSRRCEAMTLRCRPRARGDPVFQGEDFVRCRDVHGWLSVYWVPAFAGTTAAWFVPRTLEHTGFPQQRLHMGDVRSTAPGSSGSGSRSRPRSYRPAPGSSASG